MREPHVPVRTCVGCRRRLPKGILLRFVITGRGFEMGHAAGRGTYLCRNQSCLEAALKRKDLRGIAARKDCEGALAGLKALVTCRGEAEIDRSDNRVACGVNGGSAIG